MPEGRLPEGFRIAWEPGTRRCADGRVVWGGQPRRLLRLSAAGARVLDGLLRDGVTGDASASLARRLLDAGLARPLPGSPGPAPTVVVPVRDRPDALRRCLATLGTDVSVLVVDDGSIDPEAVAAVCAAHGARLLRLEVPAGPAAARNHGLAAVAPDLADGGLVAFVDSDVSVDAATLRRLAGCFADPALAAVAPRVVGRADGRSWFARFAAAASPVDMGPRGGAVTPQAQVRYLPAACLVVRPAAVTGFDPRLRYGEDVDLVWRLHDAGWRVRLVAEARAGHCEPAAALPWLARRFRYGTSAAPLARRHGDRLAPLVAPPLPLAGVGLGLAGRPAVAAVALGVAGWQVFRRCRAAEIPPVTAGNLALTALARSAVGVAVATSRCAVQLGWPALAVAATRRRTRPAALALALTAPVAHWLQRGLPLDPARWTVAWWTGEAAYGVGVWAGVLRWRTALPLLPRLHRSPGDGCQRRRQRVRRQQARERGGTAMGLMDKVKAGAEQAIGKATAGVAQGQAKLEQVQAARRRDELLRDLGAAVWAERREGGSAARVEDLLRQLDEFQAGAPGDSGAPEPAPMTDASGTPPAAT